jgi:deazaflavin-dependent oxidoreductase (nitroreductase family)
VLRVTSQRSSEFATPSREQIVAISQKHVSMMESGDANAGADAVWIWAGMHHVLLRTIGRHSGKEHKVALPYWQDPDGHRIVVASFAGAPTDPAWFLNLSDTAVNPQVLVRVQGGEFSATPEVLTGEDYATIWALLVVDRPHYADYMTKTDRQIPLVRLRESRGATER